MATKKKTSEDKAKQYADRIERTIQEYPFTTLVASFALGAFLSSLFSKKKK